MLKYLIALADELDRNGEFKAADRVDELIIHAMTAEELDALLASGKVEEEEDEPGFPNIPLHKTRKAMEKYHEWLKEPQNWKNPELVKYVIKGGREIKENIHGLSWRNCKLCDSTVTKKAVEPLLIDEE